jgi:segregation and condensation protein B
MSEAEQEATAAAAAPDAERNQLLRLLEALLFASAEPLEERQLTAYLPEGADVRGLVQELQGHYANRGVTLVRAGKGWAFRTAKDLASRLQIETEVKRKLSRAAVETLAIIAYHQPVTRAEIEEIRGVGQSKGTFEMLMEAGWIKVGRRRHTPGRPVTWVTTDAFLDHFGLEATKDLPGVEELKAAGFLDARPAIQAFRAEEIEDADPAGDDDGDVSEFLPEDANGDADEDADGHAERDADEDETAEQQAKAGG